MNRIPRNAAILGLPILFLLAFVVVVSAKAWTERFARNSEGEDRVKRARSLKGKPIRILFEGAKIPYPSSKILFRAYKSEAILELWAANGEGKMVHLRTYPIAKQSGKLGPKRKEGDLQVPEGLYWIDRFNHLSSYRLSLGINYPNASDRIRSDKTKPGSDIFIHGDQVSIGCLAMTDELIDEIFVIALDSKSAGQKKVPVYIFPCKLTDQNLKTLVAEVPQHANFWRELAPFDRYLDTRKKVAKYRVSTTGMYQKVEK